MMQALLTAARVSVGKDECQVRVSGVEREYRMGTEIGRLASHGFQGTAGDSSNPKRGGIHTATRCHTLPQTTTRFNTLQHISTYYHTLQHTATHCHKQPQVEIDARISVTHDSHPLQHTATHCYTLQHTATHSYRQGFDARSIIAHDFTHYHCHTLQHSAAYCNQ